MTCLNQSLPIGSIARPRLVRALSRKLRQTMHRRSLLKLPNPHLAIQRGFDLSANASQQPEGLVQRQINIDHSLRLHLTAFLSVLAGISHAQPAATTLPETVVTASRAPIAGDESGSALFVLDAETLQERQHTTVSDALRSVPGLSVNRGGPTGAATQVRIRGAEGNHTLVLIDGMEANDPAISSEFNFAHLLTDGIARIEVLRGPQSALWGSDAIGGVINIITQSADERGVRVQGTLEGGSFDTVRGNASILGRSDTAAFSLSASALRADGINTSRFGSETDGYENATLRMGGSVQATDTLSFKANTQYTYGETEFDPQDFVFGSATEGLIIDGDRVGRVAQFYSRAEAKLDTFDGRLEHIAGIGHTDTDNDEFSNGLPNGGSHGEKTKLDYQFNYFFETPGFANAEHTITGLAELEEERFRNNNLTAEATDYAIALEYRVNLDERASISASVREDFNDGFEDATTFRLTGSYKATSTGTRFHASVGRGVTNPSFFEQFGFFPASFVGNPDLRPERSIGWDFGFEQALLDGRVVIDVTYFDADLTNEITTVFDPVTFESTPINAAGRSDRRGVETSLNIALHERVDASFAYTWSQSEDGSGRAEVRRPKHIASANVNYRFANGKGTINLGANYNGETRDVEFVSTTPDDRALLDDFLLVSLNAQYRVNDYLTLTGRLENLLDDDYEEQFSYRSTGFGAFAGLRFSFDREP